jgi:hypothetical protein
LSLSRSFAISALAPEEIPGLLASRRPRGAPFIL